MKLTKVKKGEKIGKMLEEGGSFIGADAPAPGIQITLGSKVGFISWKELEDFKAARKVKDLETA